MPRDISSLWVRERVIPSGRQNIGEILKKAKMKEYSEMRLLALAEGRCSQDSCYIKEISDNDLPEAIRERSSKNIKVGVGGYCISFNDTIDISAGIIREKGELLSISANDILGFARTNIIDTTKACDMLECSRQNLSYLVKSNKLTPIIYGTKGNLYTKGDVEKLMYE